MITRQAEDYGYGWYIGEWQGRVIIQHGGGMNGVSTYLVYLPNELICIVVLSNLDATKCPLVSQSLTQIALGDDVSALIMDSPINPTSRLVESPSAGDQRAYVGTYSLPMGDLVVTLDGEKLMAKFASEPEKCELLRESEGSYFIRGPAGVQLAFERDPGGEVKQVKVTVRGRDVIGKKSQ
jgi:hypothetical protein